MRTRALVLCLSVLATVAAVAAEPPKIDETETVSVETLRAESIGDLIHLVDLWHDANLKADDKQSANWERRISEFIRADIDRTRWRYDVCRKRTEGLGQTAEATSLTVEQQEALEDLTDVDEWLKVKKRLLKAFENSRAFSNQYRLVGDYLQVLRMEHDQMQVKMAESGDLENVDCSEDK